MWLLDTNMDVHLTTILSEFGIVSETAAARGWKALSNGQLVTAAAASGFDCLLTRDRLLGHSAPLYTAPTSFFVYAKLSSNAWRSRNSGSLGAPGSSLYDFPRSAISR